MSRVLVLFDVDGTLLLTGGASTRCIRRAAQSVLGDHFEWAPITAGTLDPQIFLELAAHCGVADADRHLEAYKAAYLIELEAELQRVRADVRVLPGVRELLSDLHLRPELVLGLLTGNYRRAVDLKLDAAGLDVTLFRVGAFAEDGRQRRDLVEVALRDFTRVTGSRGDPSRVILVGDTPRDIACAREAGCRVLAVATGSYSLPQLQADAPDRAVSDLRDPAPLYELIDQAGRTG